MGICRLQGNMTKCGTAQKGLQRRRWMVVARIEGPNIPDIFVPLARAYEVLCYTCCDGASLLPFNPVQRLGGVLPLFFSWHHSTHHIPQIPRKSSEPDMGYGISPSVAGGRPWPFCFIKANQDFSQHSAFAYR